jgi:hypothetical protein
MTNDIALAAVKEGQFAAVKMAQGTPAERNMSEPNEHRWIQTQRYGYATFYECAVCKAHKHVEWDPGWPPVPRFFNKEGEELKLPLFEEPPCTANPVEGLFHE